MINKVFSFSGVLFILLLFFSLNAVAQQRKAPNVKILGHNCYKASIIENHNGKIIEVDDGHIYKVDSFYTIDTAFWSRYDRSNVLKLFSLVLALLFLLNSCAMKKRIGLT